MFSVQNNAENSIQTDGSAHGTKFQASQDNVVPFRISLKPMLDWTVLINRRRMGTNVYVCVCSL